MALQEGGFVVLEGVEFVADACEVGLVEGFVFLVFEAEVEGVEDLCVCVGEVHEEEEEREREREGGD